MKYVMLNILMFSLYTWTALLMIENMDEIYTIQDVEIIFISEYNLVSFGILLG